MYLPWRNKTGIAKIATILATICILSFGLCTASAITHPGDVVGPRSTIWTDCMWIFSGTVAVTLFALLFIGLFAIVRNLRRPRS